MAETENGADAERSATPGSSEPAPYWMIEVGADGFSRGDPQPVGQDAIRQAVLRAVQSGPEGDPRYIVVLGSSTSDSVEKIYRRLLPERDWDLDAIDVRPVITPKLVPDGWSAPRGAHGRLAAPFRRGPRRINRIDPPLALMHWDVPTAEVAGIAQEMAGRLQSFKLDRLWRLQPLVERLVDGRSMRRSSDTVEDEPTAPTTTDDSTLSASIHALAASVDQWERSFREAEDFTSAEHQEIEAAMKELARWESAELSMEIELERRGLQSRLTRLLDAQASRDAAGAIERLVSVLASLVLVPTLIAGTYGANVEVPFGGTKAGWRTMLAFMASGGVLTYVALSGAQVSAYTRRLQYRWPGSARSNTLPDRDWSVRLLYLAMCGAGGGVALTAACLLVREGLADTTSFLGVSVALALLLVAVCAMILDDARSRSLTHAAIDCVATAAAYVAAATALSEHIFAWGASITLGAAIIAFRVFPTSRDWVDSLSRSQETDASTD